MDGRSGYSRPRPPPNGSVTNFGAESNTMLGSNVTSPALSPPPNRAGVMSRAEKFEDEKRRIIDSCFAKQDESGGCMQSTDQSCDTLRLILILCSGRIVYHAHQNPRRCAVSTDAPTSRFGSLEQERACNSGGSPKHWPSTGAQGQRKQQRYILCRQDLEFGRPDGHRIIHQHGATAE